MFNKKRLKQKEEEINSIKIEIERVYSENKKNLDKINSENILLNEEIQRLNNKYSKFISQDEAFSVEKKAYDELVKSKIILNEEYQNGLKIYNNLKNEIEIFKDTIEIGSFGLYEPIFNFDCSEKFRSAIQANYVNQKTLISEDNAIICHQVWTLNDSIVEGRKLTKKNIKLLLLAFNGECDSIISKIKWNNVEKSKERINKAYEKLNQLSKIDSIEITKDFLNLKIEELELNYEYQLKKFEEKEEQRRIREQIREEEKALRDYEKAEREAEEEETSLQEALEKVKQKFGIVTAEEAEALNEKVKELEIRIKEAQEKKERAIALAQTTKVGYIYIISNIGSLGEDVYKIGMTRRLDPQDRVDELSNASVPFKFDVHAVIYSENAPQLEYELHQKFNDRRINRVNKRKEFFHVKLDDIESFVEEHTDVKVEFIKMAEAREYRETMTIDEQLHKINIKEVIDSKFPDSLYD